VSTGWQLFYQSHRVAEAAVTPSEKIMSLWKWTTTHEEAFLKARKAMSEMHDLAFYDQNRLTALHVESSRLFGLGFIILKQKDV
jgi:hypothetical protein